jgi:hypothetical protein
VSNSVTFTLEARPPTVATGTASSVTRTSALLNASVDPNGGSVGACGFEYGTTTSYGTSAECAFSSGAGGECAFAYGATGECAFPSIGAVQVFARIFGLSANTTYHFRIVAADESGKDEGQDETFTTPAAKNFGDPSVPPPAQGSVLSTKTTVGHPEARLKSSSLTVTRQGALQVKVTCPVGETSCIGKITLRTLSAVSTGKGKKKAVLTLASGSFDVAGGKTETVTLHLSAQARALLSHSHVLRARATLIAHDPAMASDTTRVTATLRLAKPSKKS